MSVGPPPPPQPPPPKAAQPAPEPQPPIPQTISKELSQELLGEKSLSDVPPCKLLLAIMNKYDIDPANIKTFTVSPDEGGPRFEEKDLIKPFQYTIKFVDGTETKVYHEWKKTNCKKPEPGSLAEKDFYRMCKADNTAIKMSLENDIENILKPQPRDIDKLLIGVFEKFKRNISTDKESMLARFEKKSHHGTTVFIFYKREAEHQSGVLPTTNPYQLSASRTERMAITHFSFIRGRERTVYPSDADPIDVYWKTDHPKCLELKEKGLQLKYLEELAQNGKLDKTTFANALGGADHKEKAQELLKSEYVRAHDRLCELRTADIPFEELKGKRTERLETGQLLSEHSLKNQLSSLNELNSYIVKSETTLEIIGGKTEKVLTEELATEETKEVKDAGKISELKEQLSLSQKHPNLREEVARLHKKRTTVVQELREITKDIPKIYEQLSNICKTIKFLKTQTGEDKETTKLRDQLQGLMKQVKFETLHTRLNDFIDFMKQFPIEGEVQTAEPTHSSLGELINPFKAASPESNASQSNPIIVE